MGKLTALACHPTKKVNKPEKLTYHPTNIVVNVNHYQLLVKFYNCKRYTKLLFNSIFFF
jgi:hypothetical protein